MLVDPAQMEQVVVNLVINARDVLPKGGRIIIETANIELDEEYFSGKFPVLKPGSYVMLAVSDNGTGMDEATQARIFEPFFTTKEPGKGTGLGLATVYGIISQSEGQVLVYSEVGVGTTFKIYLPGALAGEESKTRSEVEPGSRPQQDGTETILLAEDEEMVRNLICMVLKAKGYNLLEARNGEEALQLLQTYPGSIDLLVTDIMPQLGGRELITQLHHIHPHAKVLCMSGYTDRAFQQHDLIPRCQVFLQKPFTPSTLVSKIREVLDG